MIGKTVSHYKITRELGTGGMGVVYEAVDTKLDRTVALKFLPPESTRDPDAKARFVHEAKAASAIDHPNVCNIYEIDETDDGQLFLAMACYEGETLKERIARGPLQIDDALDITRQVTEGLTEAHKRDIVHRDIKPANIFITAGGLVKILDFGLAKLAGLTQLTQEGTTLGTAHYLSPEQANGQEVDHRSDLWCLGVVFYEMITGRVPFQGDHPQAVTYAILNQDPEPMTGIRTGVPLQLDRMVSKALTKNPEHRYQHAVELRADLGAAGDAIQADAGPYGASSVSLHTKEGTGKSTRRRTLILVGGIIATICVMAVLLVNLENGGSSGPQEREPIRSLAVLPFANMMGDTDQDFFVEGLHEALITDLSKVGGLRVISRTSSMRYKGKSKSMTEIGRELDVDALVEGSVLRVGNRVRVTAQLIHGASDEHIWAEDYDRDLDDVLNLLSEIAGIIAKEIDVALTPRQMKRLTADQTVDPQVHELVLKGKYHLNRFTYSDAKEAQHYFEQAVAADPDFAPAHAMLSGSHIVLSILGDFPPHEIYPPARASALKALELDPDHAGAHTALGYIKLYYDWEWETARLEFQRALELNPNETYAMHGLADYLTLYGQFDDALELVKQARTLDPFSYIRNVTVWGHLLLARRFEEIITEVEQWREFSGNSQAGWYNLFNTYFHLGQDQAAMAELRHSSTGRDSIYAPLMEAAFTDSGIRGASRCCAERFSVMSRTRYVDAMAIALYFAKAGDVEETFAWMERAYQNRLSGVHTLGQSSFDPYRDDPRFEALLRKIGIPQEAWRRLGASNGQ